MSDILTGGEASAVLIYSTAALLIGVILDAVFGDPVYAWHPIRLIGRLITYLEGAVRRRVKGTPGAELVGGAFFAALVLLVSTAIPSLLLFGAYRLNGLAGLFLESVFCYQLLAARSLWTESMKVSAALRTQGIAAGRRAVSMIVGRDTERLDEAGIVRAAVETVAENTSDGVIAPLLFMAVFGAPGGFFYKAVNTMDSMVGYRNERYLYFGRAAARLDDVCNFIPSRVSALLMILASPFLGFSGKGAFRIWRRDSRNHKSPNSAQTEAACAGALGIQLAGDAWYFGRLCKKPTIGDPLRPVETEDIKRANLLMAGTALGGAACFLLVRTVVLIWLL